MTRVCPQKITFTVLLLIYPFRVCSFTTEDISNLYRDLFNDTIYNKHAPARKPTKVLMRVQLEEIRKIDDMNEMLVTRVRVHIRWTDKRLIWDEENYGEGNGDGISSIQVSPDMVWRPDIALINGVSELTRLGSEASPIKIIEKVAQLQWSPVGLFESKCYFDLEFYPFDVQKCEIQLGTLGSSTQFIEFEEMECVKIDSVLQTSTWSLESIDQYVSEFVFNNRVVKKQNILTCVYTLRRKYKFYITTILLPLAFLGMMNPLAFLIPCDSGEKISFAITLFLSFAVYDTILTEKIPVNSDKMSYLQLYIAAQLSCTVFVLLASIVQSRLHAAHPGNTRKNRISPEHSNADEKFRMYGSWYKWEDVKWMTKVDIIFFLCTLFAQIVCNIWFYQTVKRGRTY